MDIQVRFEDGTTEMRGEHTVCWVDQVITQTREDPIGQHRGKTVWIPSAGRNGRVETADEQIARLTAERDAAVKERDAYWIRGFATALAASCWGAGETAAYQMGAAGLTLDKLRAAAVLESDIEKIALAMQRGQ
jgi:hypothetical protein